jgi:hypothetical protein
MTITEFILQWRKDMMKYENVNTIQELVECGLCADLATVISEHFPDVKIHSWNNPVHTWVEYEGWHYDMQNPYGMKKWRKLEYFKHCPQHLLG